MIQEKRYLIINADDFGRGANTNAAILLCHRKRLITDTNMMVNMPGTAEAAAIARKHPDLSVGIHAVFTSDNRLSNSRPVTRCKTLVDGNGYFMSPEPIDNFWNKSIWKWSLKEVAGELEAQMTLFKRLVGALPTHITSHHHVHAHPRLLPIFVACAEKHHLPLRLPIVKATMPTTERVAELSSRVVTTDDFVVEYKGNAHRATYRNFAIAMANHRRGVIELVVHPALDSTLEPEYLRKWWAKEMKMLTSKSFKSFVSRSDTRLINYKELSILKGKI